MSDAAVKLRRAQRRAGSCAPHESCERAPRFLVERLLHLLFQSRSKSGCPAEHGGCTIAVIALQPFLPSLFRRGTLKRLSRLLHDRVCSCSQMSQIALDRGSDDVAPMAMRDEMDSRCEVQLLDLHQQLNQIVGRLDPRLMRVVSRPGKMELFLLGMGMRPHGAAHAEPVQRLIKTVAEILRIGRVKLMPGFRACYGGVPRPMNNEDVVILSCAGGGSSI